MDLSGYYSPFCDWTGPPKTREKKGTKSSFAVVKVIGEDCEATVCGLWDMKLVQGKLSVNP